MRAILNKVWRLLTPAEQRKAGWMLLLCTLMAMTETVGVISIMPFLTVLTQPGIIQSNAFLNAAYRFFEFSDTRRFILVLGGASIFLVVASSLFKTVTLHLLNRFVHLERHSISTRLLERYLQQPYEFFLLRNPSLLSKRLLSETDMLIFNLLLPLAQLVAQGAVVLAMLALIFWYDALMACCIVLVVTLLYGTIYGLVRKRLGNIGRESQQADGQRYQACNEALGGIKDVKITHSAVAYEQKYAQAARLYARHMATNDTLAQSPLYLVEATGYSGLILIALWLLYRSNDVASVLPTLGLYGFAAYRMLPSVQIMYRGVSRLRFALSSLEAISHDLYLPVAPVSPSAEQLAPQREIRLANVCYAYPSTPQTPVFQNLDLVIEANTCVGIAGKSGAGKSTLMDLLLGLLPPQHGSLTVDGVPITLANVGAWQRAIGYVPQHIFLSDASVTENIAFGVPPDKVDHAAVERAARAAQIHEFVVHELPQGYATEVGDRGIRLSGGQRQRIGIARALYRDPPVLFMDEATSALDAETEIALNEAMRGLSGQKTIVLIAHREASLRYCDKIVEI